MVLMLLSAAFASCAPPRYHLAAWTAVGGEDACDTARKAHDRAVQLRDEGRLDRARRVLEDAIETCPIEISSIALHLDILRELGAKAALASALEKSDWVLDPEIVGARGRAQALLAAPKPSEADRAAARRKQARASEARLAGDLKRARALYLAAWASAPPNPEALLSAGLASRSLGDAHQAQQFFDRARAEHCDGQEYCSIVPEFDEELSQWDVVRAPTAGEPLLIETSVGVVLAVGQRSPMFIPLSGDATRAAVTHDGKWIATVTPFAGIRVADTENGMTDRTLPFSNVRDITFIGDRELALLEDSGSLHIVGINDARADVLVAKRAQWVVWSGDRARFVIGVLDGANERIELHARSGQLLGQWPGRAFNVARGIALDRAGSRLAWTVPQGVMLARADGARSVAVVDPHAKEEVVDVAFSADGKALRVLRKNVLYEIDFATGAVSPERLPPIGFRRLVRDADTILTLSSTGIEERDVLRGGLRRTIDVGRPRLRSIGFDAQGSLLAVDDALELTTWPARKRERPRRIALAAPPSARAIAFAPDGRVLALRDGTRVLLANPKNGAISRIQDMSGPVTAIRFSASSARLAAGSQNGQVCSWAAPSGRADCFGASGSAIRDISFSQNERRVAVASADGEVGIWDLTTNTKALVHRGHVDLSSVLYLADDRSVAIADGTSLRVWDLMSGITSEEGKISPSTVPMVLSPNGNLLFASHSAWDTRSQRPLGVIWRPLEAVAFAPPAAALRDTFATAHATTVDVFVVREGPRTRLTVLSLACGDIALDNEHHFDAPDACRGIVRCRSGMQRLPLELCDERYRVPELIARTLGGERGLDDP